MNTRKGLGRHASIRKTQNISPPRLKQHLNPKPGKVKDLDPRALHLGEPKHEHKIGSGVTCHYGELCLKTVVGH